jgi:hypothetical protein
MMKKFGHTGLIVIKVYLSIFVKSVEKIQVLLIHEKNNGYFMRIPVYVYDSILLNSFWNKKYFRQKLYKISKHILCSIIFFSESRTIYEIR